MFLLMMGSGCGWSFGQGSIFQLEGLKSGVLLHFKQKVQFDLTETCVAFEVARLSSLGDCHIVASYLKYMILEWSRWDGKTLLLVSPGLSPITDPPGTPPTSEPAIDSTLLHQPTPPHTGMPLVAIIINTCSICTK